MRVVLAVAIAVAASLIAVAPGYADNRIAPLTKMMASRSDKARLSAVLALAKLGEPGALPPLVSALRDPSARVRVVAATALGRLEHEPALPALREMADRDRDVDVRKAAGTAALKIATHRRNERVQSEADAHARRSPPVSRGINDRSDASPVGGGSAGSAGAGSKGPRGIARIELPDEPHPALYVLINSAADDSPSAADKRTRLAHADVIKRALTQQLRTEPSVTSLVADAQRWALPARHIDISVTRLDVRTAGALVEVDAQLRLTISDDSGRMLSFLSGGAKLQVPSAKLDRRYLPAMRKEALENAMRGMFDKLLAHLRDQAPG